MRTLSLMILSATTILPLLSQCKPDAEARADYKSWQGSAANSAFAERQKALDELAAKYPKDLEIQSQRILHYRGVPEAWAGVRDSYVKRAEQNPGDPVALTLAATALHRKDTPRAIQLLTKARGMSPGFAWPALKLAEIYEAGKFADLDKARENFEVFTSTCAECMPRSVSRLMSKLLDTEKQAAVAKRLGTRLDAERSPEPGDYLTLWSLEFRSRPLAEHAELRKQVGKDLERIRGLKLDKDGLEIVLSGMKQSGASPETVTAFEDRILREAPKSDSAHRVASERWNKAHKEPADHQDTTAWQVWKKANRQAIKEWAERFTEVSWLEDYATSLTIEAGELDDKQAISIVERSLQKNLVRNGPGMWAYWSAASRLMNKGVAPGKALTWMEKAWPLAEQLDRDQIDDDTLTDERHKELANNWSTREYAALEYLRAMALAGQKDIPDSLRKYLEGPMPAKKDILSYRYRRLAWLAVVEGHEADALAYFQQALFARPKPPQYFRGKVEDPLLDEARARYRKAGGREQTLALWLKAPARSEEPALVRWEKPEKDLPSFELADLSGRTWKLKQLEGKAVLINVWATWCGPCRSELPHFQKLYDETKGRSDVQVISFNVDEDFGLVEPFMKEQGYTFPALSAFALFRGKLDGNGIPQNWIVDPKGNWLARQLGFDSSETEWVEGMLARLNDARQGKGPAGLE